MDGEMARKEAERRLGASSLRPWVSSQTTLPLRSFFLWVAAINRAYFFLVADRGTMPVKRRGLAQTAIYKKLLLYHATTVQKLHTRRFGMKEFRVLTVTASPDRERVTSMLGAARQLEEAPGALPLHRPRFTPCQRLNPSDRIKNVWPA